MLFYIVVFAIVYFVYRYKLFKLIYYIYKDYLYKLKNKYSDEEQFPHLYGIYGYFGLPGYGKTMAMTNELNLLRDKYGDKLYIFTNYGYSKEDKPFSHYKMLFEEYDKPCVFAWDEVQNEFNSRDYKNFPISLLSSLTQNRKGHGKRILYTAQRYARVDKVFRELSVLCGECKTLFGRLTIVKWYSWEDYEHLLSMPNVNNRMKIKTSKKTVFVQSDELRSDYDSFQMLKTAKDKIYLDRSELAILNS